MKNKEIEELLNKLEYASECDDFIIEIRKDRAKLLLSYIEQLEKENDRLKKDYSIIVNENCDYLLLEKKVEQLEEEIHKKEAMYDSLAVDYRLSQEQNEQLETDYKEANESVTWWANRFSAVERDNRNLKNNRDKAIEVIDLITPELWNISNKMTYRLKDIKYILKGDSDE